MLTPVRSNSLATSQSMHTEPLIGQAASSEQVTKANISETLTEAGPLKNKAGKLANLLIGSQNGIANPLIKLALAVARAIEFQQKPQEIADAYRQRLIDALLAMNPDEQAQAELKTNLKSLGITLPALAEALSDTTKPIATKMIVLLEKAASERSLSFEDQASKVYAYGDDDQFDLADSLKYRNSPTQSDILTTPIAPQDASQSNLNRQQSADRVPSQTQLVRAFIDELYEVVVSLDGPTVAEDVLETGFKSPVPEPSNFGFSQPNNNALSEKGATTGISAPNKLSLTGDSDVIAKTDGNTPEDAERLHSSGSVEVEIADEQQSSGQGLSRTDVEKLVTQHKAGILAMISERLTRFPSLTPKLGDRNLVAIPTPIPLKEPALEEPGNKHGATTETQQRAPIRLHDPAYVAKLTTLFLKDLPAATLAKLQVIADILVANHHALTTEFLSELALNNESPTKKSEPETREHKPELNGVAAKELSIAGRADILAKEAQPDHMSDLAGQEALNDPELPAPAQSRNPQLANLQTPVERIAQQMQLFHALAFTPIPYPIIDEQEPPSSPQKQEKDDENEESGEDSQHNGAQSGREHDNQREENKKDDRHTDSDNPFAPDVELKRHPSDADRAFHMYQKMGGL